MEVKGIVHCLFEQSGTFKNEFKKLGYEAFDYDIQNNFGETDFIMDLFSEIDNAYEGKPSLFDKFSEDDFVMAFYPCIYFCATSQMAFYLGYTNYRKLSNAEKVKKIIKRTHDREEFFIRLIKLSSVAMEKNIRMVIENPWSEQTYLKANFLKAPDLVDMDRTLRGDYFKKPTAYWFWNCTPTEGFTFQKDKEVKTILGSRGSGTEGLCSEERSMISSDYARNFICDFLIGKIQKDSQMSFGF